MTTATRQERWRHGRHLATPAIYVLYTATAIEPWLPTPPRWLAATMTALLIGTVITSWRHDGELCERCIARMPLNPNHVADRCHGQLHTYHRIAWLFLSLLAVNITGTVMPQHWIASKALVSAATCGFLFMFYVIDVHRRLQPWCPWCRDDEDGDDTAEVPDPVDGNTQPIPA